jgi:hypothetical protein
MQGRGMNQRAPRMLVGSRSRRRRNSHRTGLYTAGLLLLLLLWPTLAVACPPILKSVTVNGNHPTSTWTLPAGVSSQFIQTSESSEVNEDGYFRTLVNLNVVGPSDTSFADPFNFQPGVYYLHVAGHDKRCTGAVCPPIEFSDVLSFEVRAASAATATASASPGAGAVDIAALNCGGQGGSGAGVTLPSTTGGPGPDRVRPLQVLSFPPVQDVDRLFVRAQMSEPGTLKASAKVSVPGASRVYAFKTVTRAVGANVRKRLRLKLAKQRLKAVKRALRRGKKLKARVTVTARDKAGNRRAQKATIRLTR